MPNTLVTAWMIAITCFALPSVALAQTVWTGPLTSFSKSGFDDPTLPANQDMVVPGVVQITRGSEMGIYNAASETGFSAAVSPADTEWAFPNNNPGLTVEASNFAALSFAAWRAAHGGNPPTTVGQPAVMHILSQDIYLDVTFTDWGSIELTGDASFAYDRATPVIIPGPSAIWVGLGLLVSGSVGLTRWQPSRLSRRTRRLRPRHRPV